MSFPTFSGSSRRPRNVNMSGQRNLNPFAATSWTPSASSTASKTVADAQAERRQRQQEREKLKAVESIQRTWRGHKVRRNLKDERRRTLDDLYAEYGQLDSASRTEKALPLVVAVVDSRRSDDRVRLERFAADLVKSACGIIRTAIPSHIRRLANQLIILLECSNVDEVQPTIFQPLISIYDTRFESVLDSLNNFYKALGRFCQNGSPTSQGLALLEQALLAPIKRETSHQASKAFAMSFMTLPNLEFFEANTSKFSETITITKVSSAIVESYTAGWASTQPADVRLWLLAHFIALGTGQKNLSSGSSSYLNAMYIQLSSLHVELKKRHIGPGSIPSANSAFDSQRLLPPFVGKMIESLVQRDEISHVLEKFTSNFAGSSEEEYKEASLLAAYILTLIRCFPALSDDIRMKLYLADIPSKSGHPNSVRFFWDAMSRTQIFKMIQSDERGITLPLLQRQDSKLLSAPLDEALWDREWRAILLFLELYVFVLRLTDDEDFSFPWTTSGFQAGSASRLRQCMLPLNELKGLALFLRNLAFTLYYNANDLQQHAESAFQRSNLKVTTVDELFSASYTSFKDVSERKRKTRETYHVISGVDFDTFRTTITTAMRMVYERDSRRRFLPHEYWLMTSRFDMSSFMDAVVLEVERQRELNEAGHHDEDEDEDIDMDEDEDDEGITKYERVPMGYSSHALRIEKMKAAHQLEQRKRLLAAVGPKLEILRNMPFVIPFDVRVKIFRKLVVLDKIRRRNGMLDAESWRLQILNELNDPGRARERLGKHHAKVRRGHVFEDAYEQFYPLREGLKEPIQITFVDQFDIAEAGIDGGGVTKEFLTSVTKEAFTNSDLMLFAANIKNALYPNPLAWDQTQEQMRNCGVRPDAEEWRNGMEVTLERYEFLGRIIGKCLYEGILIDIVFAGFFLLKWAATAADANYRANINDLREFDEELYNGMMRLKNYPGDVSELGLDFTIEDQVSLPNEPVRIVTRNLAPNGDKMSVTNENKLLYINYVARHRLVAQPFAVTRAFLTGLGAIIEPTWLSMFNQSELQRLVGGDSSEIDVEDLRRNTIYSGLYEIGDDGEEHPVIQMFWEVLRTMRDSQRRDVLKYVTSTPRAPLLGFSQLSPRFSIRDGGRDTTRLPSASTCVNLLKLPMYDSAQQLRDKLLYAVSSGAGFDLS